MSHEAIGGETHRIHGTQEAGVAFVMATLGRPEAVDCTRTLASLCGPMDRVIVVCRHERAEELLGLLPPEITLISHRRAGASAARNIGIDYVLQHVSSVTHFMFPNDRTTLDVESVGALRNAILHDPDSVIIGSWWISDWSEHHQPGMHRGKVHALRAVSAAYEPALVLPRMVFESGIRWDEVVCPGASSPWGASDGPALILEAMDHGFETRIDYAVTVDNVSTGYSLTPKIMRQKYFSYARGAGVVQQRHIRRLGAINCLLSTVGPLVGWALRRPYWRRAGICTAATAVIGRIVGSLDVFLGRYPEVRASWHASQEARSPWAVLQERI